ncbi:MAG: hypothetical protein IT245_03915 [Bacteroidia bacterium]|nr:hypothetical protein [Bacteroidia bacterium]
MKNEYLSITKVVVFIAVLGFLFSACSKEEDNTPTNNTPAQKTLNKSTLTPKKWYSQGSSVTHDFKTGGAYGASGSWSWYGTADTDTMKIVTQSGFQPVYWKFFWNTDHAMSAQRVDQGVTLDFRDTIW